MVQAWESYLQEVEVDSQTHADISGTLNRQVSRPLMEKTFYRKIQSRKMFTHRESFDTILTKTEEMLKKVRCFLYMLSGSLADVIVIDSGYNEHLGYLT